MWPTSSDSTPKKEPNKIGWPMAEALEERPVTKGNSEETAANCTQRQWEALIKLDRIREAARRDKNLRFTSLMHQFTIDLLREAYNAVLFISEVSFNLSLEYLLQVSLNRFLSISLYVFYAVAIFC
jgi:hypothetical protein